MGTRIVTVVGASGRLGLKIVQALQAKGATVRAMVRATTDRAELQALGVTDFVVGDLRDASSLRRVLETKPQAEAVVASAAGFSTHSARTKGDNSRADTEGYWHLIEATKGAGVPRFVLISILACDQAPGVPHLSPKYAAEQSLVEARQPYLSLRAGAFLDRANDRVAPSVQRGFFLDTFPGVPFDMIYSVDLARYAAQAALEVPDSDLNQTIDISCEAPVTGQTLAQAFGRVLGRPVVAKPVLPPLLTTLLNLGSVFLSPVARDQLAVLAWIRKGGYVSQARHKQKDVFGDQPTVLDSVARYCRDKGLAKLTAP